MKQLVRFYVGLEFDRDHKELPLATLRFAESETEWFLLAVFDGFTAMEHRGGYMHKDGTVVNEACAVYEVFAPEGFSREGMEIVARKMAELFKQESVLYTVQQVEGGLVSV